MSHQKDKMFEVRVRWFPGMAGCSVVITGMARCSVVRVRSFTGMAGCIVVKDVLLTTILLNFKSLFTNHYTSQAALCCFSRIITLVKQLTVGASYYYYLSLIRKSSGMCRNN